MLSETQVRTGLVRLSYVHLLEPREDSDGGKPKYSVSLIIPKDDTKTITAINRAIDAAIEEGKGKLDPKKGAPKKSMLKLPLRDGDLDRADAAYANSFFLTANSTTQPTLVDRKRQPITDTDELYSGCYGYAIVSFYAFAVPENKGIACAIEAVQKVKDGEPLGHTPLSADVFDELEDDEDDLEDFLA